LDDKAAGSRAEQAVRGLQGAFHQLFDAAPDAVVVCDREGRIVLANDMVERMLGYPRDELVGQPVEVLVPKRYRFRHHDHRRAYDENPGARFMGEGRELYAVRKDGTELPVEISLTPMEIEGQLLISSAIRDITERKKAQRELERHDAELRRSNAELEQFAYVASHDLQEPLRMVASYSQLLERRYRDKLDSDAEEFIEFIVDGATRMQALINDLLAFSRVGTRGKPFEPTDMADVVARAISNVQLAIEEAGAQVDVGPMPAVVGDSSQLAQLFQNLISNAIKFRGEDAPRVTITAEPAGEAVTFSLTDNGIGIDPQYAERIFLLFQRLHTKREYAGTGIGLAICKKIVERHGGRIWVEGKPGEGTTFHFTLPLNTEQRSE